MTLLIIAKGDGADGVLGAVEACVSLWADAVEFQSRYRLPLPMTQPDAIPGSSCPPSCSPDAGRRPGWSTATASGCSPDGAAPPSWPSGKTGEESRSTENEDVEQGV